MQKHFTSLSSAVLAFMASGLLLLMIYAASNKLSMALKYYFLYG